MEADSDSYEKVTKECAKHGKYEARYFKSPISSKVTYEKCPHCLQAIKDKRDGVKNDELMRERRLRVANLSIPPRFRNKSLKNYNAGSDASIEKAYNTCRSYVNNFEERLERGAGLLLCGSPGTGKTHLGYAILKTVMLDHGVTGAYTTVFNMLKTIRSTWDRGATETEAQAINRFTKPGLLVLDEVGVQSGTESEKTLIFQIIDHRYQHMKPTILIGNLSIKELTEYLGERVIDRMREGGGDAAFFTWDSHRKKDQP